MSLVFRPKQEAAPVLFRTLGERTGAEHLSGVRPGELFRIEGRTGRWLRLGRYSFRPSRVQDVGIWVAENENIYSADDHIYDFLHEETVVYVAPGDLISFPVERVDTCASCGTPSAIKGLFPRLVRVRRERRGGPSMHVQEIAGWYCVPCAVERRQRDGP